jgi:rubrerythrin
LVTRLFIVEVKETPEKRQSVLSAIAHQWQDNERPDPDALRQPVVAFMEWAQRRTWRVVIPFADALMALLSQLPPAERDYRDAANLLRLIAASAIWHLQHRQHAITDESVTVVADLADYALVRQLVAPAFAKTRAFALSEGERQIVDALRASDAPMTVKEIAHATNLSPTAVRCRLNRLKAKEIVADEQSPERREKVWRVVASTTFLSDLLPTPDQVRAHWHPDPTDPPKNFQTNLSPTEEGSSVHAFTSVHDPRTLENAKQDWDFCASVHAFAEHSVQAFAEHYQGKSRQGDAILAADPTDQPEPQCFTRETLPASANVRENGERTNASPKTLSRIGENERSRPLNAGERTNAADSDLEVKITCPRCGAWKRVPPDVLMLTDPRCPVCGKVMRPEPEGDPPEGGAPTPADPPSANPAPLTVTDLETGEPLVVGTNAWLEATFGTACPDCGTTLTDGACPTCGYPDDRPQWRIGRLVMAIAKTLRSRHPQCRRTPCDACRQVVARMNRAVVANDLRGLIALWREVTTDGDDEVS